jgi:uncharacterized damage-inducible protein DinB
MDLTNYARLMSDYNRWMNERMYESCAALPDEQRKRDLGAFFKSIHGTLNHLLLADRVWMGRFTGVPFKVGSLAQELHADFGALRADRARTDDAISQWAAGLQPADFDRELHYTSIDKPEPRRLPLGLTIVHFFNHQTHHRGQLTTLMKQCGVDPGVTDLLFMPAARAA